MDASPVVVERRKTGRRALWPPLRRRHDVAITVPLRRLEDLFAAPDLDPFTPDYTRYGNKPGVDAIADVLHVERPVAEVRTTIELPADAVDASAQHLATNALQRYCRVRIADLEQDLRLIRRYGTWALAIGAVAVLVLNGIANPLDDTGDDVLQLLSQGLQIAAWVTLWLPINLLVYDRWYARRDQVVYRAMQDMELTVGSADRDEA
jgi:hypothetical protein